VTQFVRDEYAIDVLKNIEDLLLEIRDLLRAALPVPDAPAPQGEQE
jgi:hypothetical protein